LATRGSKGEVGDSTLEVFVEHLLHKLGQHGRLQEHLSVLDIIPEITNTAL
jgi:hypothetical protein